MEKLDELEEGKASPVGATRKDLQIPRRLFHMLGGVCVGTLYNYLLSHQQAVYILGTCACLLYIFEQARINYPEYAAKFEIVTKYFFRAEETLKESASIPMIMALLLTILSFPKIIALVAIFTLAIADPLSAIIGIKFGKRHIVKEKSVEGSLAFFVSSFGCCLLLFLSSVEGMDGRLWGLSLLLALFTTAFEMIPLRLDDNLTIPLFTAFVLWILCGIMAIPT